MKKTKLKLDLGSSDSMNVIFANSTLASQRNTVFGTTPSEWSDMGKPVEIYVEVSCVDDA